METKVLRKGDLLSHLLLAILEIETLMKLIVPKNPSTFQNCWNLCGIKQIQPFQTWIRAASPMAVRLIETHGFPVTPHRGQALSH